MRSLLSLADLDTPTLAHLVQRAVELADPDSRGTPLAGRRIGIYFRKSSTRTRVSFWAAGVGLGADVATFGPDDLQLVTGESLEDTARVLGNYLDAFVVRTNGDIEEMRQLAAATPDLAVVNALSNCEHPTQAIADLATLTEEFGGLAGRHLLYVGEGNSTAAALAYATALTPGFRLTVVTPPAYGLPANVVRMADKLADTRGRIEHVHDLSAVPGQVDAVYTSRWQQMGVPKADPNWLRHFEPYQVNQALLERISDRGTVFLHDLPAVRGQEVTDEVLDGERSRALRQSYHKMTGAMAVLEWCVS